MDVRFILTNRPVINSTTVEGKASRCNRSKTAVAAQIQLSSGEHRRYLSITPLVSRNYRQLKMAN